LVVSISGVQIFVEGIVVKNKFSMICEAKKLIVISGKSNRNHN